MNMSLAKAQRRKAEGAPVGSLCLCGVLVSFLLASPLVAADKLRRIAVMDFENASREKSLDWLGGGIAETLTTELSRIPDFSLVERSRLNDALKELKFERTQFVDPAGAQKMGKLLGAQSIVVGSYQRFEDNLRILARLVDVETGLVKAPTRVDGPYKQLFALQIDTAKNLVHEIKGSLAAADAERLEAVPKRDLDAYKLFSDGVYFLRNDLADDAIAQFDQALKVDPDYGEAYFYKGLALEKRQRWDEAITNFKRALPRSQAVRHIKWSWEPP